MESLTRLRMHEAGLPAPQLQVWIAGFRVDFYWPSHGLVLEADGRVKYSADERWAEKRREQAIRRSAGHRVERVTWEDIFGGWPRTLQLLRSILT